jgi:dephospho-CoA kinase
VHLFGLTGGLASGKSAVAARLAARGVPVIDADLLAREVVAKGSTGLEAIAQAFGPGVILPSGDLDRKALAAIVFADDGKRRALNAIVHPRIAELGMERAAELAQAGHELACYEAALLVENHLEDAFRPLVVVTAPLEVQIARAIVRDREPEDVVRGRIRAQMPIEEKVRVADFVLDNTGTLADLTQKTDEALARIAERVGVKLPSREGGT